MVGHFISHVTHLQTIYKYIKDKVVIASKLCLIVDYDEGWRILLNLNMETIYTVKD